ncbi:MAG: AraC family transcriptional regulator [Gammaproteobacteria bacterium]|jgi:AraC-like DNA-binding protein|nr:AraC family transcriptional regulator [Gammaproteobacteria bacterium]
MTDYLVRASALQGMRQTVTQLNGDIDTLLRRTGLVAAEQDPDSWISYRSFLLLMEEAARETNCPHFGLLLSRQQDIGILGAVGFVIQQAPDLRTALRELIIHFAHHNQGAIVSLKVENDIAQWCFTCKLEGFAPMRQQAGLVAGIGVDLIRLLCPGWSPKAVYFPHAPPVDPGPYKARFDCPLFFNWDSMTMSFDAAILDAPISEANPHLHSVLEQHLLTMSKDFDDDYCGQIRHLIRQALTTGDCSIDRVAAFLAINKRSLQRKLQAHDTSYKELLEEVRFDIARHYLRESSGSLTTLADMLCYSELSVFSNAFRQHFGVSPREWKNQQAAN